MLWDSNTKYPDPIKPVLKLLSFTEVDERVAFLAWDIFIEQYPASRTTLLTFLTKGNFPPPVRVKLWMTISGAQGLKDQNPGTFKRLKAHFSPCVLDAEKKIHRDLCRTFGDDVALPSVLSQTEAIESLFAVLRALCLYQAQHPCPYSQGLSYIAASFLVTVRFCCLRFLLLLPLVLPLCPVSSCLVLSFQLVYFCKLMHPFQQMIFFFFEFVVFISTLKSHPFALFFTF
jgi:hypothetical protein